MQALKKKKKRVYQDRWEVEYLVTYNKEKLQCLACMQIIGVVKEYNVKRHYTTLHEKTYKGNCTQDPTFYLWIDFDRRPLNRFLSIPRKHLGSKFPISKGIYT